MVNIPLPKAILAVSVYNTNSTAEALTLQLMQELRCDTINLSSYNIKQDEEDDFLPLIISILNKYDHIIFILDVTDYDTKHLWYTFTQKWHTLLLRNRAMARKHHQKHLTFVWQRVKEVIDNPAILVLHEVAHLQVLNLENAPNNLQAIFNQIAIFHSSDMQ